jgi:hypothetical protein
MIRVLITNKFTVSINHNVLPSKHLNISRSNGVIFFVNIHIPSLDIAVPSLDIAVPSLDIVVKSMYPVVQSARKGSIEALKRYI